MENNSELIVYKASAGSGKTFTLAVEYIKLLISNPYAYRNILAVTFTNKATTEMKERILGQLFGIAIADSSSEAYLDVIKESMKLPEEEIRDRARKALSLLIHDYSRFRVETIDSFFQSVMRNLARELELGANMNIVLSNEEVLSDAVDAMIEKLDRKSAILTWLLEFIQERIANDKRWNVSNEIKSFGRNIFDETYIEKGDQLREKLKDSQTIPQYKKKLEYVQEEVKDVMNGFAEQFFSIMEQSGIRPEDLIRKEKGIMSYFVKLRNNNYDDSIRNETVKGCLESPENWTSKSSPYRKEIISLASSQLIPLLEEAEKYRAACNWKLNSSNLSLRYLNHMRLLTHIDEEVREENQRANRFLLSDTNNLLRRLIQDSDSSFVFEKIGTTLKHVMIDEFQDTSRMQWNNFRILLTESLAQGSGSLIVGDVKQSIYRWRNGDWSILNNLQGKMNGTFPIIEKHLNINRRSESNIIRFNNEIFTAGCAWLNNIYREETEQDCEDLIQAYQDVCQESPRKETKGYVRIEFLDKNEEMTYEERTLEQLASQVNSLVNEGVNLSDITILVRKNKNIPVIANYFSQNQLFRIVSDEAFRLDASSCVCALIDALRYLTAPDDTIALARLASVYQREVLKNTVDWNMLLLNDTRSFIPQQFLNEQNTLKLMPLYELLESIFRIFNLAALQEQDAYLFAFFDAVSDYLQENSSDIDSFLTYWEDDLRNKTIPSGELEGIRIYSIHKSKGLEFHTVIIPFCDWSLENEVNNQLIWCTPEDAPYNDLNIVPVNYSKAMLQSTYRSDYNHERLQLWVDNLNLLYVAFTRASKNLIVMANGGKSNSISTLLYETLELVSRRLDGKFEENIFTFGTLCPTERKKEKNQSTNRLTSPSQSRIVKMESFDNKIDFRQSNRSAEFINNNEEDDQTHYIKQGRLLHYLFSAIHTADDVEPILDQMNSEGLFDSETTVRQIRTLIQKALSNPKAKDWFSGEWDLFNERSIIYTDNGEMQTRRPDRVMIKDNEVIVVDFKFGKKSAAYNRQVENYMQLFSRMGYKSVHGYLWYIYTNELEQV